MYLISFKLLVPNFSLQINCFANKSIVLMTESPFEFVSPKIASFCPRLNCGKYCFKVFSTIFQNSLTSGQLQTSAESFSV